jgi:hypothetical protein
MDGEALYAAPSHHPCIVILVQDVALWAVMCLVVSVVLAMEFLSTRKDADTFVVRLLGCYRRYTLPH